MKIDGFDRQFTAFNTDIRYKVTGMVVSISELPASCIIAEYVCEACGKAHFVIDTATDKNTVLKLSEDYMKAVHHLGLIRASAIDRSIKVPRGAVPDKVYVHDVCLCKTAEASKSRSVLKFHQKLKDNAHGGRLYKFIIDMAPGKSDSRKLLALCPSSVIADNSCTHSGEGDGLFNFLRGFKADMDILPCMYDGMGSVMICGIESKNRVYSVRQDSRFVDSLHRKRDRLLSKHKAFTIDMLDSLFESQLFDLKLPKAMILLCGLTVETLPNRRKSSVSVINNDGRGFCVFYGDGGTAKSSILNGYALRFLKDTNGQRMSGETATMVGLTGGIDTSSPLGAYITEGALTKANKAMLLVDGGQQMREYISKMRECFTMGLIQIRKMLSADLPAMTRIVLTYNLRKNMKDYGSKISAMKDIGSSKQEKSGILSTPDIRRFDMFYPFEFTGKKHSRADSHTSKDFIQYYRDLLVIAWTVRPEDIIVDHLDFSKMDAAVDELSDVFGVQIDYALLNGTSYITFFKYLVASAILNGRVRYQGGKVQVVLSDMDIPFVKDMVHDVLMASQIHLINIETASDIALMKSIIGRMTNTQKKHLMGVYKTSSGRIETYASEKKLSRQAVSKVFRQMLVDKIVIDDAEYQYSISNGAYNGDYRIVDPIYARGLTHFGQRLCSLLDGKGMDRDDEEGGSGVMSSGRLVPKQKHKIGLDADSSVGRCIDTIIVNSLRESPMTNINLFGLVALNMFEEELIHDRLKRLISREVIAFNNKDPFMFYLLD